MCRHTHHPGYVIMKENLRLTGTYAVSILPCWTIQPALSEKSSSEAHIPKPQQQDLVYFPVGIKECNQGQTKCYSKECEWQTHSILNLVCARQRCLRLVLVSPCILNTTCVSNKTYLKHLRCWSTQPLLLMETAQKGSLGGSTFERDTKDCKCQWPIPGSGRS